MTHAVNTHVCEVKNSVQTLTDLDETQSALLLSVAPLETLLSSSQSLFGVVQTVQLLQRLVTPHDIQLQDGVIIHRVQQRRVALTAETSDGAFVSFILVKLKISYAFHRMFNIKIEQC